MINSVHLLTTAGPFTVDDRAGAWPGAEVAAAFADAVASGRLDLPLPGGGRTRQRWAALAQLAEEDLSLGRLAEGHTDALAILAELGALTAPRPGSRWGVWAAQPPGPGLTASKTARGWRLDGTKQYCSGARSVTDALVTATTPDGSRLFAVSTRNLSPVPGTWPATGMAGSDALNVGAARAAGMTELLRLTPGRDPAAIWLATTDADTVVPPGWLRRQPGVGLPGGRRIQAAADGRGPRPGGRRHRGGPSCRAGQRHHGPDIRAPSGAGTPRLQPPAPHAGPAAERARRFVIRPGRAGAVPVSRAA